MDKKTILPDKDIDAANTVAKYIMENANGKNCVVRIEETEESFIAESGPDIGQKKTVKKRRVAYNGYEKEFSKTSDYTQQESDSEVLPF
jgi:hypothetical protein